MFVAEALLVLTFFVVFKGIRNFGALEKLFWLHYIAALITFHRAFGMKTRSVGCGVNLWPGRSDSALLKAGGGLLTGQRESCTRGEVHKRFSSDIQWLVFCPLRVVGLTMA